MAPLPSHPICPATCHLVTPLPCYLAAQLITPWPHYPVTPLPSQPITPPPFYPTTPSPHYPVTPSPPGPVTRVYPPVGFEVGALGVHLVAALEVALVDPPLLQVGGLGAGQARGGRPGGGDRDRDRDGGTVHPPGTLPPPPPWSRGRTHSRCRSWKGAGPLSEALSSLSLGMSMGNMAPGSIFTGGGRERKAIEEQGGTGSGQERRARGEQTPQKPARRPQRTNRRRRDPPPKKLTGVWGQGGTRVGVGAAWGRCSPPKGGDASGI